MLKIIGLVGAKGAGKNTVAKLIREAYPNVREGALADRLKDVCSRHFGIPREAFDDPNLKERYLRSLVEYNGPAHVGLMKDDVASLLDTYRLPLDPEHISRASRSTFARPIYTPRQLAQYVGTEILRAVDPDVHCKALMENQPKDGVLIVTDIRFPNELEYFKKLPYVKFYALCVDNTAAEAKASKDGHTSESYLKELRQACDGSITNNDSLDSLKERILAWAKLLLTGRGAL